MGNKCFPKLVPDKVTKINGVTVNEKLLKNYNDNRISLPPKRTAKLLGVTIHNTADLENVKDDGEQYTRATLNGNMNTVRVHYYVDELCAWQNLPLTSCNWTCTDGDGPGNGQTIAIECIMRGRTGADNEKAMDNAARLTAWLLKSNGLAVDDVYTHSHWLHVRDGHKGTRAELNVRPHPYKTCPIYIIPQWEKFMGLVREYYGGKAVTYCVQVGAFSFEKNALKFLENVRKRYSAAFIKENGLFYVQVGAFKDKGNAERYLETVKKDYTGAFIKAM